MIRNGDHQTLETLINEEAQGDQQLLANTFESLECKSCQYLNECKDKKLGIPNEKLGIVYHTETFNNL